MSLIVQLWGPLAMCFLLIVFYEVMFGRDYRGYLEELFMPAALIIVIPTVTTTVVSEKATRLTESMKIMVSHLPFQSLRNAPHVSLSLSLFSLSYMTCTSIVTF